jgi:hypothetical protein
MLRRSMFCSAYSAIIGALGGTQPGASDAAPELTMKENNFENLGPG